VLLKLGRAGEGKLLLKNNLPFKRKVCRNSSGVREELQSRIKWRRGEAKNISRYQCQRRSVSGRERLPKITMEGAGIMGKESPKSGAAKEGAVPK